MQGWGVEDWTGTAPCDLELSLLNLALPSGMAGNTRPYVH